MDNNLKCSEIFPTLLATFLVSCKVDLETHTETGSEGKSAMSRHDTRHAKTFVKSLGNLEI